MNLCCLGYTLFLPYIYDHCGLFENQLKFQLLFVANISLVLFIVQSTMKSFCVLCSQRQLYIITIKIKDTTFRAM